MAKEIKQYITPAQIRGMTNTALRKEYSRLRSIANKRIQRMRTQGLGSPDRGLFPTMKGLSMSDIAGYAADVARFLRDPRSTVSGEKRFINDEIKQLQERGYDFINRSNIYDFIKFMERQREKVGAKLFDSGDAADVYNQAQRLKIPTDVLEKHFDYFLENQDALEQITPVKTDRRIRFSDISRKIKRLTK